MDEAVLQALAVQRPVDQQVPQQQCVLQIAAARPQ